MHLDDQGFGSGMGEGLQNTHREWFQDGTYSIRANQVELISIPGPGTMIPGPSVVTLLAVGTGVDGQVSLRGSQGVRITAGPPLPTSEPTESLATTGIELQVDPLGMLTLKRGILPTDQSLEMTPLGITINAGLGKVTIRSLTEISLEVADGMSKITLAPEGVTIQGLQVKLLAQLQAELQTMMNKVSAMMNDVTSAIHMFK
jgi:hypothetical protein